MRRLNQRLHEKFVDPTRHFFSPTLSYPEIEIWTEKDSIRNFISELAEKYRLSIQVLRGFASLSMYRVALKRAATRGVKKVLYLGDFDPSGLLIDEIAARETGLDVKRIALTSEQIGKYRLPSIPVNMRDSRAPSYVEKFGNRAWEIEALRPKTFLKLVEGAVRESVPREFLVQAESRERAARVARPVTERLKRRIEEEVSQLLEMGKTEEEIRKQLASRYGFSFPKRRTKKSKAKRARKKPTV